MMNMTRDVVTTVSVLLSACALVLSIYVALRQRRRDGLELARTLHADLTTGAVAEARNVLGSLRRGGRLTTDEDTARAMNAYFTILWCFERIDAGRLTLRRWGSAEARRFLLNAIHWHVVEWNAALPEIRILLEQQAGHEVDDDESRAALKRVAHALDL
jgi:hypothetical protein